MMRPTQGMSIHPTHMGVIGFPVVMNNCMAKIEPIMAVYPKIGFLEFVEMTSDVIPNAGKITI